MNSKKPPRAVCILGMHRSGTSVVSRAVNLLGAYLGEENELLPPVPDNQEGVFERHDVVNFHNRVLNKFSRTWHSVGLLPEGWDASEDIRPFRDELRELVVSRFGQRPLWAWKDPRTTLLLPLWKSVLAELGISLSCVYVVRNPLDVARSLQQRESFPYDKSFGIWLTANLAALDAVCDVPTVFVSYDRLLSRGESELRRCASGVGLQWPEDDSELRETLNGFLRPGLRHSTSQIADLAAAHAPQPVIGLYKLLRDATDDAVKLSEPTVQAELESLRRGFDDVSRCFHYDVETLLDSKRTLERRIANLESQAAVQDEELRRIHRSLAWRVVKRLRHAAGKLFPPGTRRKRFRDSVDADLRVVLNEGWANLFYLKLWPYRLWISRNEPKPAQFMPMRVESQSWPYKPVVSIVTPVFNPTKYALTNCIQSVLDQIYEHWEFCVVDGGSDRPYVRSVIEEFAKKDSRIKYIALEKNRGIAGNSNAALKLATGEFVAFLDHDDMLAPFALYEVVKLLNAERTTDLMFSDEDKMSARTGWRYAPQFKSGWAPDTFLSYNYLCHFAVIKKVILDKVGGFREGFDGAQDYDLLLRISEHTSAIKRIPKVLYHWRAATSSVASGEQIKPYAAAAARKAITEHLRRRGLDGEVTEGLARGTYRVKYRVKPSQPVSIIIPTRDRVDLLKRSVATVLDRTRYEPLEIVIIDNGSEREETLEYLNGLGADPRVRVARYDRPFNFSAINNYAVRLTNTEYVLFLNNDTEVVQGDWLSAMMEFGQRRDVGAVGCKLYYPNNSVQHAGTIIGYGGVADHAHKHFRRADHGYMGRINLIQNLSAVTAACMLLRREVFDEVGGYDEQLSHSFNDVDLCLKIRAKGYLIVYTPYAELYHHESVSRGYDENPEAKLRLANEISFIQTKWKRVFKEGDPYYNPNLTLDKTDFSIRI